MHACDDKRVIDPALKESALLTGVFNRLARSCFYGVAVKEGDESPYRNGCIPAGAASATVALRDAIEPHAHITLWLGTTRDAATGRWRATFRLDWIVQR